MDGAEELREVSLHDGMAQLARFVLPDPPLDSVLQTVAGVAKSLIPAAAQAPVSLLTGAHFETVASTGAIAIQLDERQYEAGTGPCMHAATKHEVVLVPDTAIDERWPGIRAAGRRCRRP